MMGRIESVFAAKGKTAFIGFAVAGDPDKETSVRIAKALIDGGTDILEFGVPFSDPVADGPTIQRADDRALAAGTTPDTIFEIVRESGRIPKSRSCSSRITTRSTGGESTILPRGARGRGRRDPCRGYAGRGIRRGRGSCKKVRDRPDLPCYADNFTGTHGHHRAPRTRIPVPCCGARGHRERERP